MNEMMQVETTATMDSREIAELTGKRHSTVIFDIESQIGKLGGEQEFLSTYTDASNRQSKCYRLPYRETMILVSGYSVELRAKVIDRWMELERAALPKPLTGAALLAAAVIEAQKVIEQKEAIIEAQRPAVQFMADVTGSRSAMEMSQAAKVIGMGMGRNKLFDFLRANGVLRENNEPYQKYVDAGWFRVVEQSWQDTKGETHVTIKTLAYQKGIDGIIKMIRMQK